MREHARDPFDIDDDPWGFGRADGHLLEVRQHQLVLVPSQREVPLRQHTAVVAPAVSTPTRPPRRRRWLVASAAATLLGALGWGGFGSAAAPPPPRTGALVISSHPAAARVTIGGVDRGQTPLALRLEGGTYAIGLSHPSGVTTDVTVDVVAGESRSRHVLLAPSPAAAPEPAGPSAAEPVAPVPAPAPGVLAVETPFVVDVFVDGRRVGSSGDGRLTLRPGSHQVTFVSEALGYRASKPVRVLAGRVSRVALAPGTAPLNVNAAPWAEVVIDGTSYGETPLANIPLSLGAHALVLRHPTLGARTVSVTVRGGVTNRLSVDLRR